MVDCFDRIQKLVKRSYSSDEIKQILRDVQSEIQDSEKIAGNKAEGAQDIIQRVTKQLEDRFKKEKIFLEKEDQAVAESSALFKPFENLKVRRKILKRFGESLTLQTKLGVKGAKARALILRSTRLRMEARNNLTKAINSVPDGMAILKSGEYKVPIQEAINGKETNNKIANALGKVIREHRDDYDKRFKAHGIEIRKLEDRGNYQFHDPQQVLKIGDTLSERTRIRAANIRAVDKHSTFKKFSFERWRDDQERLLDVKRTFGNRTFTQRNEIYRESYDNISSDATSLGKKSIQSQFSANRFFHYKDEGAQLEYGEKYGGGDQFASLMKEADRQGAQLATLELAGNRPLNYIEKTIRLAAKESKIDFTKDEINRGVEEAKYNMQATLGHGTTTQGLLGKLVKAIQFATFAKIIPGLPALVLIADVSPSINKMASLGGRGAFRSAAKLFTTAKDVLTKKEDLETYAQLMGLNRDITLGSVEKWSGLQNRDLGGKLMSFMMKISPHEFMNYVEGLSSAHELTFMLGRHSNLKFDELPGGLKKALRLFGLDDQWDLLKKGKTEIGETTHLTIDAMRNIPDDDVKDFLKKKFNLKKVSTARLEREREKTQMLFSQMVTDNMATASNMIDARQTKIWTLPFSQTTDLGRKAANLFSLFGSLRYYETAIVHRTLAPLIFGDTGESAFRQIITGKFDKIGLARWAAISYTFSMMGFTVQSLLKGQEPDFDEINIRSMLSIVGSIGQGLELGSGFGHSASQTVTGPAVGMLLNVVDDLSKIFRGDHPGKNAANLVTTAIPPFNSSLGRKGFRALMQYQFGNMWG